MSIQKNNKKQYSKMEFGDLILILESKDKNDLKPGDFKLTIRSFSKYANLYQSGNRGTKTKPRDIGIVPLDYTFGRDMFKSIFGVYDLTNEGKGPFGLVKENYFEHIERINMVMETTFGKTEVISSIDSFFEENINSKHDLLNSLSRFLLDSFLTIYKPIFDNLALGKVGQNLLFKTDKVMKLQHGIYNSICEKYMFMVEVVEEKPKFSDIAKTKIKSPEREFQNDRREFQNDRREFQNDRREFQNDRREFQNNQNRGGKNRSLYLNKFKRDENTTIDFNSAIDFDTIDQDFVDSRSVVKVSPKQKYTEFAKNDLMSMLKSFCNKISIYKISYDADGFFEITANSEKIDTDKFHICQHHSNIGSNKFPSLTENQIKSLSSRTYGFLTEDLICYDSCHKFVNRFAEINEISAMKICIGNYIDIISQFEDDIKDFGVISKNYHDAENTSREAKKNFDEKCEQMKKSFNIETIKLFIEIFSNPILKKEQVKKEKLVKKRKVVYDDLFTEPNFFDHKMISSFYGNENKMIETVQNENTSVYIGSIFGESDHSSGVIFFKSTKIVTLPQNIIDYMKSLIDFTQNFIFELIPEDESTMTKKENHSAVQKLVKMETKLEYLRNFRTKMMKDLSINRISIDKEIKELEEVYNAKIKKRSDKSKKETETKNESASELESRLKKEQKKNKKTEKEFLNEKELILKKSFISDIIAEEKLFSDRLDEIKNVLDEKTIEQSELDNLVLEFETLKNNGDLEDVDDDSKKLSEVENRNILEQKKVIDEEVKNLRSEKEYISKMISEMSKYLKYSNLEVLDNEIQDLEKTIAGIDFTSIISDSTFINKKYNVKITMIEDFEEENEDDNEKTKRRKLEKLKKQERVDSSLKEPKIFPLTQLVYEDIKNLIGAENLVKSSNIFMAEIAPDIKINKLPGTEKDFESYENNCYSLGKKFLYNNKIGKKTYLLYNKKVKNKKDKKVSTEIEIFIYTFPYELCLNVGSILCSNMSNNFISFAKSNQKILLPWDTKESNLVIYNHNLDEYSANSNEKFFNQMSSFKVTVLSILLGFYKTDSYDFSGVYKRNHLTQLSNREQTKMELSKIESYENYNSVFNTISNIDKMMITGKYNMFENMGKSLFAELIQSFGENNFDDDIVVQLETAETIIKSRINAIDKFNSLKKYIDLFSSKISIKNVETFVDKISDSTFISIFSKKPKPFEYSGNPANLFPFFSNFKLDLLNINIVESPGFKLESEEDSKDTKARLIDVEVSEILAKYFSSIKMKSVSFNDIFSNYNEILATFSDKKLNDYVIESSSKILNYLTTISFLTQLFFANEQGISKNFQFQTEHITSKLIEPTTDLKKETDLLATKRQEMNEVINSIIRNKNNMKNIEEKLLLLDNFDDEKKALDGDKRKNLEEKMMAIEQEKEILENKKDVLNGFIEVINEKIEKLKIEIKSLYEEIEMFPRAKIEFFETVQVFVSLFCSKLADQNDFTLKKSFRKLFVDLSDNLNIIDDVFLGEKKSDYLMGKNSKENILSEYALFDKLIGIMIRMISKTNSEKDSGISKTSETENETSNNIIKVINFINKNNIASMVMFRYELYVSNLFSFTDLITCVSFDSNYDNENNLVLTKHILTPDIVNYSYYENTQVEKNSYNDIMLDEKISETEDNINIFYGKMNVFISMMKNKSTKSIDYSDGYSINIYEREKMFNSLIKNIKSNNLTYKEVCNGLAMYIYNNHCDLFKAQYNEKYSGPLKKSNSVFQNRSKIYGVENNKILLEANREVVFNKKKFFVNLRDSYLEAQTINLKSIEVKKRIQKDFSQLSETIRGRFINSTFILNTLIDVYSRVKSDSEDIGELLKGLSDPTEIYIGRVKSLKIKNMDTVFKYTDMTNDFYDLRKNLFKILAEDTEFPINDFNSIFEIAVTELCNENLICNYNSNNFISFVENIKSVLNDEFKDINTNCSYKNDYLLNKKAIHSIEDITKLKISTIKKSILEKMISIFDEVYKYKISSPIQLFELDKKYENEMIMRSFDAKINVVDGTRLDEIITSEDSLKTFSDLSDVISNFMDEIFKTMKIVDQGSGFYFIVKLIDLFQNENLDIDEIIAMKEKLNLIVTNIKRVTSMSIFESFVSVINGTFNSPIFEQYINLLGCKNVKNFNSGYIKYPNVNVSIIRKLFILIDTINSQSNAENISSYLDENIDLVDNLHDARECFVRFKNDKVGESANNSGVLIVLNDELVRTFEETYILKTRGVCYEKLYESINSFISQTIERETINIERDIVVSFFLYFRSLSNALTTYGDLETYMIKR